MFCVPVVFASNALLPIPVLLSAEVLALKDAYPSEVFLSACIIVVSFFGGVKDSLHKLNEETSYWAKQYKETDDKVSAYIKVSDPKTTRLYIDELNKLLDDMNRLGSIIEGGEELNNILINYEKEYIKLQTKVFELIDEIELVEEKLINQDVLLSDVVDDFEVVFDELKQKLKDQRQYTADVKVSVESKLKDVENDVIIIKDSKYGKKIWKIKKK